VLGARRQALRRRRADRACSLGLEAELLSADRRLEHQARLVHGEYRHAVGVLRVGARTRLQRHGRGLRIEGEVAGLEERQRIGGREADDLGVRLPAKLKAELAGILRSEKLSALVQDLDATEVALTRMSQVLARLGAEAA
jgi:hypothetical protein